MYWRRFKVDEIPTDDIKTFETWLRKRWDEKDDLLEQFMQNGRFPSSDDDSTTEIAKGESVTKETYLGPGAHGYIETRVKSGSSSEFIRIYIPLVVMTVLAYLVYRATTELFQ